MEKPKIAVLCANVPLMRAFRLHHSWFTKSGSPGPFFALGQRHCSVPHDEFPPLFSSNSSLNTHRNFLEGRSPFFSLLRRALANGQPITFQNSAHLIFVGSIFSAAPMEENKSALVLVAVRMSSALFSRLSMASMM